MRWAISVSNLVATAKMFPTLISLFFITKVGAVLKGLTDGLASVPHYTGDKKKSSPGMILRDDFLQNRGGETHTTKMASLG